MKVLIILSTFAITSVLCEKILYNNYKVYRVTPNNEEQVEFLNKLQYTNHTLDFWKEARTVGHSADIMVPPHQLREFEDLMNYQEISYQVHIYDVQKLLDKYDSKPRRGRTYGWDTFYNVDETYAWLRSLNVSHSDRVKIYHIGRTYEKRDILAIKISSGGSKKAVFVDGGMHAREWSGVSTATYLINQLLTSENPEIQNLANSYDWYILPIANPDGYYYSHLTDRFWRKTRHPYGECFGVDPNRNFDFEWLGTGQYSQPCLKVYAGPKPFSEPETIAFAQFVKSIKSEISVYLTLHSYGQVMLYPHGYTWRDVDNLNDHDLIAKNAVAALAKRHRTKYEYGSIYALMYAAFGNTVDWMKGEVKVPLNFAFELRDKDNLDPDQIIPCADEILDALVALLRTANDLGYFKQ